MTSLDLNAPLSRLLRLRGMLARSVPPDDAKIGQSDAPGLVDAYNRLRESTRELAADLRVDLSGFDREFPALTVIEQHELGPTFMIETGAKAKTAATSLKSLAGYVEGLIEAVVLDQQISMEQIHAAREAARQPPGFR